jgi:cold-inducible RNA-binding protein
MKIFVGNLSFDITEGELEAEFSNYGEVESVIIPSDKLSGRPKGFAFVEMGSQTEAETAIAELNGKTLNNRTIVVNESRPREDNRSGSFFGNRRSGGFPSGKGSRKGGNRKRG